MKILFAFAALTLIKAFSLVNCFYDVFFVDNYYLFEIPADSPQGYRVGTVEAFTASGEAVKGNDVKYSFVYVYEKSEFFILDPKSGDITVAQSIPIDFECSLLEIQATYKDVVDRANVYIKINRE